MQKLSLPHGRFILGSACAWLLIAGCASVGETDAESDPSALSPTPPAGKTPAPVDHGHVSTGYPAFKPSVAQIVSNGGPVLSNPVVVTVTWPDEPNVAALERVADTIGTSSYWKAVVGEYGVGALKSGPGNHVHVATPLVLPAGPDADPGDAVVAVIRKALGNTATSGWPAPTDQSIYLAFIHGAAAKQLCDSGYGGYHDSFEFGGKRIPFAIAAACPQGAPFSTPLDVATSNASHELAEAATDPFPSTSRAWGGVQKDQLAWDLLQRGQDENADMCEFYEDAVAAYGAPELPFHVQRSWSNASAAAGHAPCVPAPKYETNFNVAPLEVRDDVAGDFTKSKMPYEPRSKGYHVPVGQTRVIPLGFYSDGPTEAFAIEAFESDPLDMDTFPIVPSKKPTLTLSLDKTRGRNGEKAYLSITVNRATDAKVQLVVVRSELDAVSRLMPILIGTDPPTSAGKPSQVPRARADSSQPGAVRERSSMALRRRRFVWWEHSSSSGEDHAAAVARREMQ